MNQVVHEPHDELHRFTKRLGQGIENKILHNLWLICVSSSHVCLKFSCLSMNVLYVNTFSNHLFEAIDHPFCEILES
jgi:hypothetical protein